MVLKLVEYQVEISFDATWYSRMNDDWVFPVAILVNVMDTETWRVANIYLYAADLTGLTELINVLVVRMDIRHEETPLPQEQHHFSALFVQIAVRERKVSKRQLLVAERRFGCQVELWVARIVAHDHLMIARFKLIQPITIERRISFYNRMVEAEHICAVHFVHGHTELMYQLASIVLHEPAHEVGLVVVLHMANICIWF